MRLALSLAVAMSLAIPTSVGAFNSDARCGGWMLSQWTVEVDPGTFDEGVYTVWWKFTGPATGGPPVSYLGPGTFTVSDDAAVIPGNIPIYSGLTINPDQNGYFWAGFIWDMTGQTDGPWTMPEVLDQLRTSAIYHSVAAGTSEELPTDWVLARGGPPASSCANLFGASWLHRTYPSG